MKRTALFSACILLAGIVSTAFITSNCLQQYWGTKQLYQPADTTCPAPPAGYEPVFINHVGRHGTRHLTNLNDLLLMQQVLKTADSANALTDAGHKLAQMITNLLVIEKKEDLGLLTETGKEELHGIGERMRLHYPTLANDATTFMSVSTTKEKRTHQSAVSFMEGFGRPMTAGSFTRLLDNDSVQLRFFEVSPGYKKYKKNGNWRTEADKLAHSPKAAAEQKEIAQRFFKDSYATQLLQQPAGTADKKGQNTLTGFIDAVLNVAGLANSAHTETVAAGYTPDQVDVRSLFTCDEFAWLEYENSVQDFLQKGPGMDEDGIQVRNAVPLLVDFINTSDSFLQQGNHAIVARFGHAETMAPFAALLEIKGAATPVKNIADYDKVWHISSVIGFSANLQWVFYKSKDPKKDVLVKILYNEKPVEIPIAPQQFPYYRWTDVRAFYLKKLNKLNVNLHTDMLNYLMKLA